MRLTDAFSVLVFFLAASVANGEYERQAAYYFNPYNNNPYQVNQRIIRPTITTTTTSTSIVTCTKSLNPAPAACPAGRRRRGILFDDDISPSIVHGVEATPEPSTRDARAADPQLISMSPFGYYDPGVIQPGFYGGPQNYYHGQAYGQSMPQQRLFFNLFPGFIVTSTSTIFTLSTSTSTPSCATGGFLQCPI